MGTRYVTVKGGDGETSYKVSSSGEKFYVYRSGDSIGTAGSLEDAISLMKSHYGKKIYSVDLGDESDSCFPASARVLTPAGYVQIDSLSPGDEVLGLNPKTQLLDPCIVLSRINHGHRRLYELRAGGRTVLATRAHAFRTETAWKRLIQLSPCDRLLMSGCAPASFESAMPTCHEELVYNLRTSLQSYVVDGFIACSFAYAIRVRMALCSPIGWGWPDSDNMELRRTGASL